VNLLAPVPWLKLAAAGVLFWSGWYLGAGRVQGLWDAATVAQERDYLAKVAAAQAKGQQWQAAADAASKERDDAKQTLATYVAAHPLGPVWLCSHPQAPPTVSHNPPGEPAGTAPPVPLQPAAPRDIGPALDALLLEADTLNENYRVCRSAYLALH